MNEIVFLGIFDKIANWIFSGISKAITWLVENVIAPVCSAIWENFLVYLWEMLAELVSTLLYKIYAFILCILYAVESVIYSLAGVRDVTYNGETGSILNVFFTMSSVKKAFVYVTCISLVLLFLFTVVAVARSTLDFSFDGKRSINVIMTNFVTAAITFMILPVFCYGLVQLSSICMTAFYNATSAIGGLSLTDNLYMMSLRSSVGEGITEAKYNELALKLQETEMFWYNFQDVKYYIDKAMNVDYVVGVIGALLLIINLLYMAAMFIQRILEVILLYIGAPFFVSTMPLDDGERFNKWRSAFIGRLCMGVGMIMALNIVIIILSVVVGGTDSASITFVSNVNPSDSGVINSAINSSIDILLKLVFMVGSIMSVGQAGGMITSLIDQGAGGAEAEGLKAGSGFVNSAAGTVAKGIGKVRTAAHEAKKESNGEARKALHDAKLSVKSKFKGFKGDHANDSELEFTKALKDTNRNNSVKAAFTKQGGKYAAINGKIEEGNKALSDFKKLKTHEEREQFMKDFADKGGMKSLKVDGKEFGSSQMANSKERKQSINLQKRIDAAEQNRDKFKEGSAQWNKYNDQVKDLTKLKKEFNGLNTHDERAKFTAKNSAAFADIENKSMADIEAGEKLDKNVALAKDMRDAMPKGSAEWQELDKHYNDLKEKQADFSAPMSAEQRQQFMKDNKRAFKVPSSQERKEMVKEAKHIGKIVKQRDMFDKGSDDWNKYDKKLDDPNTSYKNEPKLSSSEKKAVKNLDKNMERVKKARDAQPEGSEQRQALNDQLSSMAAAKDAFENPNSTSEDRASLMENNKSMFEDNTSSKEDSAMKVLNSKISEAEQNRDMFAEGSEEWNTFNDKVTELKDEGFMMQSITDKKQREEYISSRSEVFEKPGMLGISGSKQMKNLNANIARAQQNRDRHKVGSAGWKKCDAELTALKSTKAQFAALGSSDSRKEFAAKNSAAFEDKSKDKNLKALENSYQNWSGIAKYSNDPETKEHAQKMASSYRNLSEEYQRAPDEAGKAAVMQKVNAFEQPPSTAAGPQTQAQSVASNMGGASLTPKEYDGISKVMATGNEPLISQYMNSTSHSERSEILKKVNTGEVQPFAAQSQGEKNFKTSMVSTGEKFSKMAAEAPAGSPEAQKYAAISSFCTQAAEQFDGLSNHVQREKFADFVNKEISSASAGMADAPPAPKMQAYNQTLAFNQEEQAVADVLFSGDVSTELQNTHSYKQQYFEAESHEERTQIVKDYATYCATADAGSKMGAACQINTEGLSAKPKPAAAPAQQSSAPAAAVQQKKEIFNSINSAAAGSQPSGGKKPHETKLNKTMKKNGGK